MQALMTNSLTALKIVKQLLMKTLLSGPDIHLKHQSLLEPGTITVISLKVCVSTKNLAVITK
jgi:hypothetical protein